MNELLELTRSVGATGWIFLCAVGAIALGLLAFDRRRERRAAKLTVVPGLGRGSAARAVSGKDEADAADESITARSA